MVFNFPEQSYKDGIAGIAVLQNWHSETAETVTPVKVS